MVFAIREAVFDLAALLTCDVNKSPFMHTLAGGLHIEYIIQWLAKQTRRNLTVPSAFGSASYVMRMV